MAEALVSGKMDMSNNVDNMTALILDEMTRLCMKLVVGNGDEIIVSPDNFKRFWEQVRKKTNSSMSLVHF